MSSFVRRVSLILLLCGLCPRIAIAQSGPQALINTARVHFPVDISFRLQARSDAPISQITLLYGIEGQACDDSQAQQALDFTAANSVDVNWQLNFSSVGNLPPGVQVWWQWDIRDDAGTELITPKQTHVVDDTSYDWHSLTRQSVTVTWSQGSQAFGSQLLTEALNSLNRLQQQLGVRPAGPIVLVIYPNAEEVRNALVNVPEWTGGVAFPQYNITVIGIAPGENSWAATVIPHELAHLVVGVLTFNCRGIELPTWLNEGLAVVAQGPAATEDLAALEVALRGGALPPLRSLANGFQADADQASLSYTRSGQVVRYLIETYGSDHLATLLSVMQAGSPIDAALEQVYGLDTDGLDSAWRVAQGAPALAAVATPVATGPSTAVPTLALWTAVPTLTPTPRPTPPALASSTSTALAPTASSAPPTKTPTAPAAVGSSAAATPWRLAGTALILLGLAAGSLGLGLIFRLVRGIA